MVWRTHTLFLTTKQTGKERGRERERERLRERERERLKIEKGFELRLVMRVCVTMKKKHEARTRV